MSETTTKLSALSDLQVAALEEVFGPDFVIHATASTAVLRGDVHACYERVSSYVNGTTGRQHPRASLHAVVRKLGRYAKADELSSRAPFEAVGLIRDIEQFGVPQ